MKLCVIGDLHFGKTSNDFIIDKKISECLLDEVFPVCEEEKIDAIIQLGDVFDSKNTINVRSGMNAVRGFFSSIVHRTWGEKWELYQVIGNHDILYKNDMSVSSLKILYNMISEEDSYYFNLINDEVYVDEENDFTICSWGTFPKKSNKFLFGHFDIRGFEYQKGIISKKGIDPVEFKDFKYVFSGHFHKPDKQRNICYVGSLIATNWSEVDYEHGFYIIDTVTEEIKWYPIKTTAFEKIDYDENSVYDFSKVKDKLVKVVASKVKDEAKFRKFIENLNLNGAVDVKVNQISLDEIDLNAHDTIDDDITFNCVMRKYIDEMNLSGAMDKEKLKTVVSNIYNETLRESE